MIQINLNDPQHRELWDRFGRTRIHSAQAGPEASLLQGLLRLSSASNQQAGELFLLVDWLAVAMECFWTDRTIQHPIIAKKDITHNRRILFYLERFLFPLHPAFEHDKRIEPIYDMDLYDAFVLLVAAYLHDYGKGQFRLIIPELQDETLAANFRNAHTITDPPPEAFALLEDYHSLVISQFLQVFIDKPDDPSGLRTQLHQYYDAGKVGLDRLIKGGSYRLGPDAFGLDDDRNAIRDANEAERRVWWILCRIARLTEPGGRNLLQEIQIVCRSHKPYKTHLEDHSTDFFEDIHPARLRRLAALLRLADNLDLTRERLEVDGIMPATYEQFVRQIRQSLDSPPDQFMRIFTKWSTFALVKGVRFEHEYQRIDGQATRIIATVIFQYYRFPSLQQHLLTLRGQVEKDFVTFHYLAALCCESSPDVQLRLLYEIVVEAQERDREDRFLPRTERELRELFGRAKEVAAGAKTARYTLLDPSETTPTSTLAFSTLPCDLRLPTSRDFLYLLHYLRINHREKSETIATELGIPRFAKLYDDPEAKESKVIKADPTDHQVEILEACEANVARLLHALEEQPFLVRQKVREIERFGHLLPLSAMEHNVLRTGVDGLDKILDLGGGTGLVGAGIHHARNVLVLGGPGTGKTTLLLQILHHNLRLGRDVLMLTFEELESVVALNCSADFGWSNVEAFLHSISLRPAGAEAGMWRKPEQIVADMNKRIQDVDPEIVAIDSLSRLRWEKSSDRTVIDALLRSFKIRGISMIGSLEDRSGLVAEEEYQADGVIRLTQHEGRRDLLIEKLRNQGYARGKHPFEILDRTTSTREVPSNLHEPAAWPLKPGINVYPNEQYYAEVASLQADPPPDAKTAYISTGVEKLDALLPGADGEGYRRGNTILVLGSPGAGKTLFGLHFLKSTDFENQVPKTVLWLSFEGPKRLLHRSVESFDPEAGFAQLLGREGFLFLHRPLALISPEKVLYLVDELILANDIRRVVVDSVSEIEEAFQGDKLRFRRYMMTLIDALASRNVTSMFLYRVPGFFDTARESQSEISTLVDTIIAIKTFDMKNEMRRGLFVLKSRGREQRSQLQTMEIDSKRGITISYKGWEMEGLLSGQTGSIHEPEVFLKHFYENPAEREINVELVEEFRRRYASKGRFTEVQKPAIYSEFWSFKGHHGAGHANIRIVSISRYMVAAFRDLGRLHELQEFFPETLSSQIERDPRWSRYSHGGNRYDAIPMYTDLGVLAARKNLAFELHKALPNLVNENLFTVETTNPLGIAAPGPPWSELRRIGEVSFAEGISWQEIAEFSKKLGEATSQRFLPYAFALPRLDHLTEFMAFFFEILWSLGGDIYHFPVFTGLNRDRDAFYKGNILRNHSLWRRLLAILEDGEHGKECAIYGADQMVLRLSGFRNFLADLAGGPRSGQERETAADQDVSSVSVLRAVRDDVSRLILDAGRASIEDPDILTVGNRYFRDALAFLYDIVFDSNGSVPNPCRGDFRDESIFSRCWYSQLQSARDRLLADLVPKTFSQLKRNGNTSRAWVEEEVQKLSEDFIILLPVPYFTEEARKRCCTTEAEWCVSVVKQALSPEIGWIYIDTLTSTDWVERRARQRRGFPFRREEMDSMSRYDPSAYRLLEEIMNTKHAKDKVLEAERELMAKYPTEEANSRVSEAVDAFFRGRFHLRDVGDVIRALSEPEYEVRRRLFVERLEKEVLAERVEVPKWLLSDGEAGENRISELSDFEISQDMSYLARRSKIPAHRPFFHRVERILHEEIAKVFSLGGRREWFTLLTGKKNEEKSDVIDDFLCKVRDREKEAWRLEKQGRTEPELTKKLSDNRTLGEGSQFLGLVLRRMTDRVIFDLLTTVTSDHLQLSKDPDAEGQGSN